MALILEPTHGEMAPKDGAKDHNKTGKLAARVRFEWKIKNNQNALLTKI